MKIGLRENVKSCILSMLIVACGALTVFGSGLETNGIGARARSMGFAMVGMADDWSVIHYNPAGPAMIKGRMVGGEYEFFTGGMSSTASLRNLPPGAGDPWRNDFTDPTFGGEPSSFNKKDISSNIHFGALGYVSGGKKFGWGIGLYGSGSGTAWEDRIYAGSDTIDAEISFTNGSANMPVVLAWRVNPELALGATFGFHWGLLTTKNLKIRYGAGVSYTMDSEQDTQGFALGVDLGLLWKVRENLSLGAVVKLPYTFRKEGETKIHQSLLPPFPLIAKTDTTVDMEYPLRIALGLAWDITDGDLLGLGFTWLNWDQYEMSVDYKDEIPLVLEDWTRNPSNWENSIRLHAGYEHALNEKWDLRCGLVYDQAPEPEEYRTLTGGQVIDVFLFTTGAGVDLGSVSVDFGYIFTYGPPVKGFIPGAEYSMLLHEFFVGMTKAF